MLVVCRGGNAVKSECACDSSGDGRTAGRVTGLWIDFCALQPVAD